MMIYKNPFQGESYNYVEDSPFSEWWKEYEEGRRHSTKMQRYEQEEERTIESDENANTLSMGWYEDHGERRRRPSTHERSEKEREGAMEDSPFSEL